MQNALVNINGQIFKPNEAKVPVFDRGFLYGDSLYEVVRTYGGEFVHMMPHLERMEKSAALCRMVLAQPLEEYRREMQRTLDAFHQLPGQSKTEAYCRIIVTRGIGKIGFGLQCITSPTQYVIICQPLDAPTPQQYAKGLKLRVVQRLRNNPLALDPAMKSGNYLNSLLAFLEAAAEDFDDALMCNADGHLTEGTTFNIGYVRNGIIVTPPLDIGILDGITRKHMIEVARKAGYPVREARFPKERLYEADEVFMTSTTKEVFPVTRVDDRVIRNGKPGPITQALTQAFRASVPEWKKRERA